MSAYGELAVRESSVQLPATRWPCGEAAAAAGAGGSSPVIMTVLHMRRGTVPEGVAAVLYTWFTEETERGTTYPQESPVSRAAFDAYFLAGDLFVAVLPGDDDDGDGDNDNDNDNDGEDAPPTTLATATAGRKWQDCLGGTFYVKQNYPGRSGHICNAGFLVPTQLRGRGIATALANSYVHYAPRLGYHASVFNLVYANNVPSLRIWERLGFERIGCVPRAGRLKKVGGGEEYVDAWIVYKSFVE